MVESLRRGVDLHRVPVLTDRSCGCAEICIPPQDAFYRNARLTGSVFLVLLSRCLAVALWPAAARHARNEFFGYFPWLEC